MFAEAVGLRNRTLTTTLLARGGASSGSLQARRPVALPLSSRRPTVLGQRWSTGASRAAAVQLEAQRRAQIAAESGGAAKHSVDDALAERIRLFQFRDIRPKAASELPVEHASRLLGHSEKEITERVYRRIGEVVKPTK